MQIAFTSVVYPALILAYMGQAAYLSQHHFDESDQVGFYVSVPGRNIDLFLKKNVELLLVNKNIWLIKDIQYLIQRI